MIFYLDSRVQSLGQFFLPIDVVLIKGDDHLDHHVFLPDHLVFLAATKFLLEVGENLFGPVNLQIFHDKFCFNLSSHF